MDDTSNSGIWVVISAFAIFRLLNSLLKSGFFNLGQISQLSLAEKAKEENEQLGRYLNDPMRLVFAAQLVDKLSLLMVIVIVFYTNLPLPTITAALFLYLILFDVVIPHAAGAFHAESLVMKLFPLMHPFYVISSPITGLMVKLAAQGRALDDDLDEDDDPEDIKAFLRAGAEEGIIEEKEKALLRNLLVFSDTVVREVMTPRTDIVCVDEGMAPDEILEVFKETKFSRLPVYRNSIDHIVGVLRFKDLVEMMDRHTDISGYLKETMFIPEQKNISDLLQEMLTKRIQMVMVIDEFGGTAGLITLEDLIEEIIGEIHDEHEAPESDEIIRLDNGEYLVDGKVPLEDFCEMFSADVENDDVDTVGGYIFNNEGRIPKEGDASVIGDITVKIARADERRIYQIRVPAVDDEPLAG